MGVDTFERLFFKSFDTFQSGQTEQLAAVVASLKEGVQTCLVPRKRCRNGAHLYGVDYTGKSI